MSSPPTKRQRTENAPITRSDIWYPDGSVVFQAENTQFRVHWSIVSQHSSFFRGMQDLPQPPDQPSVDGCPVVELLDAVVDVTHLLKVLYNPSTLLEKPLPLPAVAALIHLGRKYDFRELLDSAIARLTFENPATLAEYDALLPSPDPYTPTRIVHYPGVLFDILTLARENNILTVLPCAYYRALRYHSEKLFDGILRPDGSLAILAPAEQRQCALSRLKLIRAQSQPGYAYGWLLWWAPAENCPKPDECRAVRDDYLSNYLDVLRLWALTPYVELEAQFCAVCKPANEEAVRAGREAMWKDLPEFFDLPPWSELKNDL
ncbi:hypothetical protein FB451DRAFT_1017688 [Mycena latifolia]|nr:hypothetical protein FB451DRAFT_1017688 [Mycena latifolia]